jgi:hypothetical protein
VSYDGDVDVFVSLTTEDDGKLYQHLIPFLRSLHAKCSLGGLKIHLVKRACSPLSRALDELVEESGFAVLICPLDKFNDRLEDTSRVCDWMIGHGGAPWFTVLHFDLEFLGDYFAWLRGVMPDFDMVGRHHDGVVSLRREAVREAQVGFCGAHNLRWMRDGGSGVPLLVSSNNPILRGGGTIALDLDVGDLMELRFGSLNMRQLWHKGGERDFGHSDLFVHYREGSMRARAS